ncbi:HAAS signaling domain-containing protein [Actinacidiphila sp. bgisy167]|uniref:HAAS signaling domain-containing protein n=1 Tax=Actinacidiphila sp. bgisy167 TaxID=3413797 RepID=UPI003D705EF4
MGAEESDRLVLDYLSKVGDLAQTSLPADRRRDLVAQLREDIDRQRRGSDNPAVVRRILGRMGAPDTVVQDAAAVPAPRAAQAPPPQAPQAPVPPEPQWWRLPEQRTPPPSAAPPRRPVPGDELDGLPGMTGGLLIPQVPEEEAAAAARFAGQKEPEPGSDPDSAPDAEQDTAPAERRARRRRWRAGFLETAAALLLLAGAALGSWIALLAGWAVAYGSRRLSRRASRFAALGLPGLTAGGALVWVWGRFAGRWGEPIPEGGVATALADALPVVVRIAAVASAAFLLWWGGRAGRSPR